MDDQYLSENNQIEEYSENEESKSTESSSDEYSSRENDVEDDFYFPSSSTGMSIGFFNNSITNFVNVIKQNIFDNLEDVFETLPQNLEDGNQSFIINTERNTIGNRASIRIVNGVIVSHIINGVETIQNDQE
ncbi:hypothetical protein PVAND_007284 [Polypedilum vanderplanki]|uniref:Uncharacterized protein n=1 Tax=Polypedilum vanderplanki TaxID=319348 RepID=A0A9J6C5Z5_POLVA|nr:hypothetical protein PVAND_007284 [Polypedilum vanderplanki]